MLERIITLVRERIPARFGLDPFRDVQVLAPMHGSLIGTRNLNAALQDVLNPAGAAEVERHGWKFRVGDKVLQLQNNYQKDVFNGDIARIHALDATDQELTVVSVVASRVGEEAAEIVEEAATPEVITEKKAEVKAEGAQP